MVSYVRRYSPFIEWTWDFTHQVGFNRIKEELTRTPELAAYFNPKSEHVIVKGCLVERVECIIVARW